jgi:hypothetical protein
MAPTELATFYETYEVRPKNVRYAAVYNPRNIGVSTPNILARKSERMVHCHTAEPKTNRRVTIDWLPLYVE